MDTNTTFDVADEMLANTYATVDRCGYQTMAVSMRPLQPVLCLGDELGDSDDDERGHCDCEICQIYGSPDRS